MKSGDKQCRIAAGQQTCKDRDAQQPQQHLRVVQGTDLNGFSRQRVEPGQDGRKETQGHHKGQAGRKHGFAHELYQQLAPPGADGFPNGHFFGSGGGLRGGQIHKVDTGDEHDKRRHSGENVDIADITVAGHIPLQIRPQMDVGHRLQPGTEGHATGSKRLKRLIGIYPSGELVL